MKKTFLARRNALISGAGFSWGGVALACAFLVLLVRLAAPGLFWHLFAPAFAAGDTLAGESRAFFSSFADAAALARENAELTSENESLASENLALNEKAASLSALLGSSQKGSVGIVAGVIARPPESPYDTLVLAAGAGEGVTLGMEAFGSGGVPMGVVTVVGSGFSRVTLFSTPGVTTSGWVGRTAMPIELVGAGGGTLTAATPAVRVLAAGDPVFLPGPGMLPVGSVARIEGDPSSPGVTLHIAPAVNLFSLGWVELRATGAIPSAFATSTEL